MNHFLGQIDLSLQKYDQAKQMGGMRLDTAKAMIIHVGDALHQVANNWLNLLGHET